MLVFAFLELVLGPRLWLLSAFSLPDPNPWIRIIVLLFLSLLLVRVLGRVNLADLGLYSLKRWTLTEKSYFLQIIILSNIVFSVFQTGELSTIWTHQDLWGGALSIFAMSVVWGFYQELIYRGILQTELTRRWGTVTGIIISNLFFTFGPLHFYHFRIAQKQTGHLWIFAAIFAIGLFFAILKQRSGNLWIVGILHGIGDWYLVGIAQVLALTKHV